jgi:hypothetical protein
LLSIFITSNLEPTFPCLVLLFGLEFYPHFLGRFFIHDPQILKAKNLPIQIQVQGELISICHRQVWGLIWLLLGQCESMVPLGWKEILEWEIQFWNQASTANLSIISVAEDKPRIYFFNNQSRTMWCNSCWASKSFGKLLKTPISRLNL